MAGDPRAIGPPPGGQVAPGCHPRGATAPAPQRQDIMQQMPTEGRLFREVDGTWREIMASCVAAPKALEARQSWDRHGMGLGGAPVVPFFSWQVISVDGKKPEVFIEIH